ERLVVRLLGDGTSYINTIKTAQSLTKKFSDWLTRLGRTLTKAITAPLTIAGGTAIKTFADFDKAMTESTSIMKVTAEQTDRMRKQALKLSSEGVQGPAKLAESYFFLASAGLDAEQSIAALPAVQKFAAAGAFDM